MGKALAIKGHSTRGKEVMELLEMMGGHATFINRISNETDKNFFISDYVNCFGRNSIRYVPDSSEETEYFKIFTLEEFLEKFPYKVGDKVHIYVQNDDIDGRYDIEVAEISSMRWDPNHCRIAYKMKDINREFYKDEIKDKVDDNEENLFHAINEYEEIVENSFQGGYEKCKLDIQLNGYELPDGYHFADENGNVIDAKKIRLVKNASSYPKTSEECCNILKTTYVEWFGYYGEVLVPFQILIICRDAYWKIAGEELGLDKPWKPVWDESENLYTIHTFNGEIRLSETAHRNAILVFPTEEIRDTFYENFKELIETCKELL